MKYNLFLDDIREPPCDDVYVVVRNYDEFVNCILAKGVPDHVSFDHDLSDLHYQGRAGVEKTGYDCAKWLAEHCEQHNFEPPTYAVHSMNPVGANNIRRCMQAAINYHFDNL